MIAYIQFLVDHHAYRCDKWGQFSLLSFYVQENSILLWVDKVGFTLDYVERECSVIERIVVLLQNVTFRDVEVPIYVRI